MVREIGGHRVRNTIKNENKVGKMRIAKITLNRELGDPRPVELRRWHRMNFYEKCVTYQWRNRKKYCRWKNAGLRADVSALTAARATGQGLKSKKGDFKTCRAQSLTDKDFSVCLIACGWLHVHVYSCARSIEERSCFVRSLGKLNRVVIVLALRPRQGDKKRGR